MPASSSPRPEVPFSARSARPIGKGYSEIMQMVLAYAGKEKNAGNPTLQHSLDCFRRLPEISGHLAELPLNPLVLIQGYSTPGNAGALRRFLQDFGRPAIRLETVDLYDLPHLYAVLDIEMPAMAYHIADAARMDDLYPDQSVDLVVQDFLLNCIPASRHEALLREAARVLRPGGLALLSFTSSETLKVASAWSTDQLRVERRLVWDAQAYDLSDIEKLNDPRESLDFLRGHLLFHPATSEFVYVTTAGGRFEFFRSQDEMRSLFSSCGLRLIRSDVTQGSDDHGLPCTRYRCLLARPTPVA